MGNFKKLAILGLLLILNINASFSQGIDPGGNGCPVPGTCDDFDQPGNLPIDGETVLIFLGGVIISVLAVRNVKRSAQKNII